MKALSYLLGRQTDSRTLLLLTIRDVKSWKELFVEDGIGVQVNAGFRSYDAETITPDVPRIKKYWRASLEGVQPFVTVSISGGARYKDLMQQLKIDTKRRFTNILIVLERK